MFFLQNFQRRLQYHVANERDAVNPLFNEELREFWMVTRCLPTDADLAAFLAATAITSAIILFTADFVHQKLRRQSRYHDRRRDELIEIIRANAEAIENLREFFARMTLLGISHMT